MNFYSIPLSRLLFFVFTLSLIVYSAATFTYSEYISKKASEEIAKNQLELLTYSISDHLKTHMQLGGDVNIFRAKVENLKDLRQELDIQIYRTDTINNTFYDSRFEQSVNRPADVEMAFNTGEDQFTVTETLLRYIRPMHSTKECLHCHLNAKLDQVLGVVSVTSSAYTMRGAIERTQRGLIIINYLFSVSILIISFIVIERLVAAPVRKLSSQLKERTESGNYDHLDNKDKAFSREINELHSNFASLLDRLRHNYTVMQDMANTDALTGLLNRRGFMPRLETEIKRAKRYENSLALISLDLNDFKPINDECGHAAGDRCLASVAEAIKHMLREEAVLARVGGDEFLAVVPNLTAPDKATEIARRIEAAISSSIIDCRDGERFVTASVGWAIYPCDGKDAVQLERIADQRMYDAKRQSRRR